MDLRREIEERLLITKNWDRIAEEARLAVEALDEPEVKAEGLLELGRLCGGLMLRADLAISAYQQAFKVDGRRVDALQQAQIIYWNHGNLEMYTKLLKLELKGCRDDERKIELQHRLGLVQMDLGDWKAAKKNLKKVAKARSDDLQVAEDLAAADHDQGNWASDAEAFRAKAEDADPTVAASMLMRAARILFANKSHEEAEALLRNVLEFHPGHSEANLLLETVLSETGRVDQIWGLHVASIETTPEGLERDMRWAHLGRIWSARFKDMVKAAFCYARALEAAWGRGERFEGDLAVLEQVAMHAEPKEAELALGRVTALNLTPAETAYSQVVAGLFFATIMGDRPLARQHFQAAASYAPEHEDVREFFGAEGISVKDALQQAAAQHVGEFTGEVELELDAEPAEAEAEPPEAEPDVAAEAAEAEPAETPEEKPEEPSEPEVSEEAEPQPEQAAEPEMEEAAQPEEPAAEETPPPQPQEVELVETFTDEQQALIDAARTTEAEQPDRAADAWRKAAQAAPEAVLPRLELARVQTQLGRWNGAADALNDALKNLGEEHGEKKKEILFQLIDIYKNQMRLDVKVLDCFKQLMAIDPTNLEVLDQMAGHLEAAKRYMDLIGVLQKKAEVVPSVEEKVAIHVRVANLFLDRNNQGEAVKAFEAVLELDRTNVEAIERLKEIYQKRREWEKLIAVYEKEVELTEDPDAQLQGRLTVARLAAEKLRQPTIGISLWEKVLEADLRNLEAMEHLEKLYEREKAWDKLADVCEKQVELLDDPQKCIQICQKLGVLFSDKVKDHARAITAWKRLLSFDPNNRRAQDSLKKIYIAAKAFEELEAFYGGQDKWDEFIRVMERQVTQEDPETQVLLHSKMAELWRTRIGKPERAVGNYEKILSIDQQNLEAAEALIEIFTQAGNNKKLASVLEVQLAHTEDPALKLERVRTLSELYESKLRDPKTAMTWLLKAFAESWEEPWLREELERLAEATRRWLELVDAYEQVFDKFADPADSLPLRRVVSRVYETEIADPEKALEVNRAILEISPEDVDSVEALERLYLGAQDFQQLLDIYRRKLDLVMDSDQRRDIYFKMAQLYEDELADPQKAIESYTGILDIAGEDLDTLKALDRLYHQQEMWPEYSSVLERQLALVPPEDVENTCQLKFKLGQLKESVLQAAQEAIGYYRDILEVQPEHHGARQALEVRLGDDEAKLDVSYILEPLYREQQEWERLVQVYEIQVAGKDDPLAKVELLLSIGEIWGQNLGDFTNAFSAYSRAFREDPTCQPARQELVRLCEIEDSWSQLVTLYSEAVAGDLDPQLRRELLVALADIYDTRMDQWEEAVSSYRQALDIDPDDWNTLEALEKLYTRREQWAELLEIYRRKVDMTSEQEQRENLFFQMAYLQEEMLGQVPEAIGTYREIVAADDTNLRALKSLDRLYFQQEAWHELADNLARQLELTIEDVSEQVELLNRLASLRQHRLEETAGAVDTYRKVLELDPENRQAADALESLLDIEEYQLNVAQILEPIYKMRDDWQKSVRVYEITVKHTYDPVRKLELLHQIGELYEIAGDDSRSAFQTYGRALAEDPANEETQARLERLSRELESWEDLVSLYRAQAESTTDTLLGAALFTRVAQILDTQLQDLERASEAYNKVLEIDPERIEAAEALEQMFIRLDDSGKLVETLLKKSEMVADLDTRKQLCFRAAQIQVEVLDDQEAAITTFSRVLEMDDSDPVALDALEGLYVKLERWENLKDVYMKMAELAPTDEERKQRLYVLGQVYDAELQDADRAIETYRSILDIDPEDFQAITSLDRLYFATENWYELHTILEREVELAGTSAEVVGLKHRIGSLWEQQLTDLTRAVEAYREVLTQDATHEPTLQALDRIAHGDAEPVLAAKVLEPVYHQVMDYDKLADIYEVMVVHAEDNLQKVELLHQAAALYEQQLDQLQKAFDAYGRAVQEDPTNEQSVSQLERLAGDINAWPILAQLYEDQLEKILDSELQIAMLMRVARVYEEELGQVDDAVAKYQRSLDHDPEYRPAILALDRLFGSAERWSELTDVLRREIRMAASDEEMVELQFKLGQIFEQNLQDMDNAIEAYREILTAVPDHVPTLSALELLFTEGVKQQEISQILEPYYTDVGQWEKLVKILQVQLEYVEDLMDRMSSIQRIAEICEHQLFDNVEAFRWWGRGYLEDPTSELAVEELERLAQDTDSWNELVQVYDQLIETRQDNEELVKAGLLRKARVCEEHTLDTPRWEEALLKALELSPADGEALAGLDRLYTKAQMHEELAEILKRRVGVAEGTEEAIELHFRLAQINEVYLENLDAAVESYQAVMDQDMRNVQALEGLEKIYFHREEWQKLHSVYEKMLDTAAGDSEMADCYARMAKIASDALDDAEDAKQKWHQVLDLRGEDPMALGALADLYERAMQWQDLVEILERQVMCVEESEGQIALYARLGRILHEQLDQDRQAMDAWLRILEIDPSNMTALWALAGLYRQTQAWEELAETLYRLIELGTTLGEMSDEQLLDLYAQVGELQGAVLMRPQEAIDAWQRVLTLDPANFKALGELENMFIQEARWEECVEVLERKVNALQDIQDRIDTMVQIASIWEDKVEGPTQAAEVYERVLEMQPSHMMASQNVENIYRDNWEWEKLIQVLIGRVEHLEELGAQVETLQQVAKIYEEHSDPPQPDQAFEVLLVAFRMQYTNDVTASELERLATATDRWNELLMEYNEKVQEIKDIDVKCDLLVKIGRWYGSKLNRPDYAISALQQALQLDNNNTQALAGLGDFYRAQGAWAELVQVLARRSELEEEPEVLAELYLSMAQLYEEKLVGMMDQAQAIQLSMQCYQKALAAEDINEDALNALDRLYRSHGQWEPLIEILRRKADLAQETDAVIDLKFNIGEILEDRLDDAYRAIESYREILTVDPQHLHSLKSLEKLYEKTGQMEEYLDILEQQLDYVGTDEERISKYQQMAAVWEEHFDKVDRSTECYEKILLVDDHNESAYRNLERLYRQEGKWEDLVDTYYKHVVAIHAPNDKVELYRLMGEVYDLQLKDPDRSVEAYRSILDYDADHVEALDALGRLYEQTSDWDQARDALHRLAQLVEDPTQKVEAYHRLGHILEEAMGDVEAAEERYVQALELNPAYLPSMNALTEIYRARGDWMKAAKMMVTAEGHTNNVLEKTKLLHSAGMIYLDELEDRETAIGLLARALEFDPEHVGAAEPLSDLYFESERWEELEPILDMLVRKAEGMDSRALNELYYRAAFTAHMLDRKDKAVKHYQMAYDMDSTYLPTLKGMAAILYDQEHWDRSFKIYQTILVHHREAQSDDEITDIFYRLGNIKLKLGERKKALNMYEKALEVDPAHRDTLTAVIALQSSQNDWEAVIHAKRALTQSADDQEIFGLLEEIGDVYYERLNNPQKAISAYQEALDVDPANHAVLHKTMERYYETKQWKKAIDIIDRFIEMEEDPKIRSKYSYTAATIFRDELKSLDEAVEYFERTLDDNWEHLKAFQAIDKLCTQKKDWKALERQYRAMIKRVPPEGQEALATMLWHNLGEIYRTRMRNYENAIAAFEVAAKLEPDNQQRHEMLAELFELVGGQEALIKAIGSYQTILKVQPKRVDMYKKLFNIYRETRQYDKAWCVASALAFHRKADAQEMRLFEEYRQKGLVRARQRMGEELWTGKVFHPNENRLISAIFGVIAPAVAAANARTFKQSGLKRKDRRDLATDQLMFTRLFNYVLQVLNLQAIPDLYLRPEQAGGLLMGYAVERGQLVPWCVVGASLLQGRSDKELAFAIAKELSYLRPEHFILRVVSAITPGQLKGLLLAGMKLASPQLNLPGVDPAALDQQAKLLQKHLAPAQLGILASVTKKLMENPEAVDLTAWLNAVECSANRVGFIISNDLPVAANMIRLMDRASVAVGGMPLEDKVADLVLYSISEEYFDVRAQLGLVIGQ